VARSTRGPSAQRADADEPEASRRGDAAFAFAVAPRRIGSGAGRCFGLAPRRFARAGLGAVRQPRRRARRLSAGDGAAFTACAGGGDAARDVAAGPRIGDRPRLRGRPRSRRSAWHPHRYMGQGVCLTGSQWRTARLGLDAHAVQRRRPVLAPERLRTRLMSTRRSAFSGVAAENRVSWGGLRPYACA